MPQTPFYKIQPRSSLPMILVLLALIAGFIFYFQIIRPGQVNKYEIPADSQREISRFKAFKDLELDFSIFERADFKGLRVFGEVPVKTSPGGKQDLFSP
ncbi:MAG: hypothetical protein AAB627_00795 [Patescibacteria group bacterium]